MLAIAIWTMLLGVSLAYGAYDCGDAPDTDGCSAWSIVPYKSRFRSSCDKHDVCYSCGRTFGVTRSQCDKEFKSDMYAACRGGWWCKKVAYLYYKAVDWHGYEYYVQTKPAWCKAQTWYRTECMP
ncbi:conodipine-P3-like [Ruditapes philippinarum]|uniref:conodipine-P3-like n=1 Tax=Ruditapes philippinarum TaxID=129788 RepID=UPI00295C200A|nr:conodipine-P3-like [Ruditapes philippinarum]